MQINKYKASRKRLLVLLILVLSLPMACDIIEQPYLTDYDPGDNNLQTRRILLEEFTGHQCPNCPEGAAMAEMLAEIYGDRLVVVAIHAGFFARVSPPPFDYDFQTQAGTAINDHFGVQQYPSGMINRQLFQGSRLLGPGAWAEAISSFDDSPADFTIELSLSYDALNRHLQVNSRSTPRQPLSGDYRLVVQLTEDHIIKPQKTNNPVFENGVIMYYDHKHVLRASLNGTWGQDIPGGPIAAGEAFEVTHSRVLDQEWNPDNMHAVVYIYNLANQEVLQVAKAGVQ